MKRSPQPQPPKSSKEAAKLRASAKAEVVTFQTKHGVHPLMQEFYRRAKAPMRQLRKLERAKAKVPNAETQSQRLFQELQVHQVELELQNDELQKARDEMEAWLEQYSDLYEFAPVGYFTLTPESAIRQVNLTGAKLVGIERSRLVGQSFKRLVRPELGSVFTTFLKQVFADGIKQSSEFALLRPGQPTQFVNIEAQRTPKGQECRAAVMDITARKLAEDKVRVSEIRYRRLFEAAHDGVLLIDPVTRKITDANPFMTQLLGYPNEQLVGKELYEIGLLKDEAASREMFRKLKRTREVRYEDLPLKSQTGGHQEVEVVANLYQEDGHAVIQCNIRDITARRGAEHELAEKARLLDLSHDAIIVRDMQGHVRYWNHGAEELYGWSREQALGKVSNVLLRTKFPVPLKQMTEELHRTDRWIGELVHTKRDGRRVTVLARKTLDRDSHGHPVAVLENITDITKRKEAEEILRRSEALFAALVAQAPVGVYVVNSRFQLQQVNPTALLIFKNIEPLLGRDFSEIIHVLWSKRVADQIVKHFRHTLKTGAPYHSPEFVERRQDTGVQEIYEWQIQRVTLPAGEHGVVCFFNNITARRRAEEAQHRLEVLAATNRELHGEILRRQAVEASLKLSEQHQIRLLNESRQLQAELQQLSREVLQVQEEERKRISRELHDVIAQTLTGINVRLATLKGEAGSHTAGFDRNLARTQRLIEKSVDLVHRFARELRPAVLDDLGLIPALHSYMKDFAARTGLHTRLTAFAEVEQIDIARRTVLFRVAQEALLNVSRHAHASRVEVNIQKLSNDLGMTIKDDGKSFDAERVLHAKRGGRLGLLGMRERLEMVGGKFSIESAPGKGTTIIAQIPLGETAAKERGVRAPAPDPIRRPPKQASAPAPRA